MQRTHKEKELNQLQAVLKENKNLKTEVRRLRKELEKFHDYVDSVHEMDEDTVTRFEDRKRNRKETIDNSPRCEECNSTDIVNVRLGVKNFIICKTCKARKLAA